MCFSQPILREIPLGKYTVWAKNLSPHALLGLLKAIGAFSTAHGRLFERGVPDPVGELAGLIDANSRLQAGLDLLASVKGGSDSPRSARFDFEIPVEKKLSAEAGSGLTEACKAILSGQDEWAAKLSERQLWILLWGVGEFGARTDRAALRLGFKARLGFDTDRAQMYEALLAIHVAYLNGEMPIAPTLTMPEAHRWLQAEWMKMLRARKLDNGATGGTLSWCNGALKEPYLSQSPEYWANWNTWFPYGRGMFPSYASFPRGGIMVLGQDSTTEKQFNDQRENNRNFDDRTSAQLRRLLRNAGVAEDSVFLTNAFMGFRTRGRATDPFPGWKDPEVVEVCRAFFLKQIELQRPRAILALGGEVIRFVAAALGSQRWANFREFPALDKAGAAQEIYQEPGREGWIRLAALLHPSYRVPNLKHGARKHLGKGADPEISLVKWADTGV